MVLNIDAYIPQPWLQTLVVLVGLVVIAMAANWITKLVVRNVFQRLIALSPLAENKEALNRVVTRLSHIVPAAIVQFGIVAVPHMPAVLVLLIRNVAAAFIILAVARAISAALDMLNRVYERRPDATIRPIKSYLQVGSIVVYCIAAVLMVAAIIDRSPLLLLSGLGAIAAVLMLVFKDTILSLVASVQITSNDIVRVGDWIEMPQLNADGFVIDIALHTVKVQNWDKTITTLPTHRMITEPFKNWRAMFEYGGRKIQRSLLIDQTSIRFLEPGEVADLHRFSLIDEYLNKKEAELAAWNTARPEREREVVNARRLTNFGTFRAYVMAYLQNRADISDEMLLLVRQLAPTDCGVPLEIYCFTTTTAWVEYEPIQSDIFDHLLAILPEFGLRVYQKPTGLDIKDAFHPTGAGKALLCGYGDDAALTSDDARLIEADGSPERK